MSGRLPIVGVMGSGVEPHGDKAEPLGAWLAQQGVHLLTGGGRGVMAAVSEAFHRVPGRRGLVIGILPGGEEGEPKPGYPNPFVEIPIRTHLPFSGPRGESSLSRNPINILTADVIVALPGGEGTASEIRLALRYGKPLVAWLDPGSRIPGLDPAVTVAVGFGAVRGFVSAALEGNRQG